MLFVWQDVSRLQPFQHCVWCHNGEQLVSSRHRRLPRFHLLYLQSADCELSHTHHNTQTSFLTFDTSW